MPRFKRIFRRLAIGLAILLAMLLIINGTYNWYMGRQLQIRLAKLRAAGEPTTFAELASKTVPADQDAGLQLLRLGPRLKAFTREQVDFENKSPLGKSFHEREQRGEPPTSEQIAAIREILSHYPKLAMEIDAASRCQGYTSQFDYTVPDSLAVEEVISGVDSLRSPYRFLRWNTTVLLADEKQDEALIMGMVMLRLARHYNDEPGLVRGLTAIGVRIAAVDSLNLVLRAGPIPTELRGQLDQELLLHEDPMWIQHVIRTERVISLSASRSLFSEAWWLPWMERGLQVDMLDFYQRLLPIVSQPWHKSHNEIRRLSTDVSYSAPVSRGLIATLQPSMEAAVTSCNRNTAMLRCLRILNGLTGFAQIHGHEAETLSDLTLPDAAKVDPFSGQPLKLKWTDKGWVVYTVFENGTDDNGNFNDQADWGLGPSGYAP